MSLVASSSSSDPSKRQFDVFVSFRGADTRNTFTSYLLEFLRLKGIDAFFDGKLRRGKDISVLFDRIEQSKMSIIVFSENYANSTWCLEELWKIMQCREKFGHGVLPVFYKVRKSDVENQKGSFGAPFLSPKDSFKGDVHKVGAWKEALKIASNILGYVVPDDRPEIEFVEKIAKETLRMLNDLSPCEISGFPGIESRSKELEELLMFDNTNCIRTVGVLGMTGIGKTTVADSVYKRNYRQFDGYCFLEDIKNLSERHGLHHLHQKLLCKLLDEENVDVRAHGRLKDFLRNKKLFIVLDNVTDVNQIEVLIGQKKLYRNGSRIVITTRDKKLVQNNADATYVVPRLNDREAMELFCLDAFSDNLYPAEEFLDLSNNFVYYAKGHPLALKLLGSGLRQKERTYWVEKWERLTVMPDKEIQKVLKMSYEALDDEQKIIFLVSKNESERDGSEAGKNLIGIKFLLEKILPLIHCHQPSAPQIVGLWGMAGIGKTAITREIFRMEAQRYDLSYFLPDFHLMCQTKGLSHLRDDFFSKIFGEEKVFIDAYDTKISFTRNRFLDKKILIVLDGVSNVRDAEVLVGGFGWFSGGHTIILTSRNRQVLVQCKAKELYKIPRLSKEESLRLCCQIVTEQKWRGWMSLISVLVTYAGGIPLALRVLGLSVQKQRINVEKQKVRILHQHLRRLYLHLRRLRQHPPIEIQDAFRNSFNGLHDNEKNIFLDLACFFRGEDKDHVVNILDGCGFLTDLGICALIDESLISLVDNNLQMPNIFQDMGRFVVCQEYEAAGKRTRLWDSNDIVDVLSNKTGTEAVEGIYLDMSGLSLELSPTVFERMYRLRLLKLHCPISENHCKVCLPQGLHSLPDELRLLHWERYPLEFLPRNFNPKNLVELKMPYSNIKRLWKGTKNLEKLKRIILSHSPQLTTFPRLSKARNLEHIDLEGCVNLVKVNSSILHNHKLTFLSLKGCSHLQIMPPTVHLESLEVLNLSGCSELENLHDFSPNLKELYLAETAIREMPSSIGDLTRLVTLDLENCERLQHLPPRISNLKAMVTLNLSGCSNLKSLPNLDALFLSDSQRLNTKITKEEFVPFKLHSAIQESRLDGSEIFLNFDNLQLRRDIHGSCFSRDAEDKFLPAFKYLISHSIPQESWPRVAITLLPSSIVHSLASRLYALVSLFLCNTDLVDLPEELSWLASVKTLDLGGNSFSQIPKSIKELHKLHNFRLRHCKNLISLPELPRSLEILNAHGCVSLESFPLYFEQFPRHYTFSNCFNLSPEVVREFIRKVQYSAEGMAKGHQLEHSNALTFSICIPASAGHKSSVNFQAGSSVMTELTPGTLKTLSGFVLSVVVEFCDNYRNAAGFGIKCIWRKARPDPSPRLERIFHCWAPKEAPTVQKDHMFVFGVTKMHPADGIDHGFLADLFTFEFHPVNWQNKLLDDSCSVKRCGVYLITAATCDRTHSAKRSSSLMNPGELSSVEHMAPPYKRCRLKRVIESVILSLRKRKREKSASRTTNLAKVQLGFSFSVGK